MVQESSRLQSGFLISCESASYIEKWLKKPMYAIYTAFKGSHHISISPTRNTAEALQDIYKLLQGTFSLIAENFRI